jgi:hypothetical protein
MKYSLLCYYIGLLVVTISCERVNHNSAKGIKSDTLSIQPGTASAENIENIPAPEILDTMLFFSNHQLHFRIYKGQGVPILFENGAGDDCSVWDTILIPIAKITGATLITYDRAGFGLSSIDNSIIDISKHGILSGLEDLENSLKALGYNQDIMLVSHSFGGYYTTLYAEKHPDLVKSIVLIDVNHNFYENTAEQEIKEHQKETMEWKKKNIAFYYMAVNLPETSKLMSTVSIPGNIPVVDFIDGISFHETKEKTERWIDCHKKFVESHPKSIGITAIGCEHYIWLDNPDLIISVIAKSYAQILSGTRKLTVYQNTLNYMIAQSNVYNPKTNTTKP